jgi:AcrR family transcriptional regulator
MTAGPCGFRRARRPEQVAARRAAILDAAVAMLRERPVAEISLRELSDQVGLAKSNVLRYFDSREAIFLEVLDRTWEAWLDGLAVSFGTPSKDGPGYRREVEVASAVAQALLADPLLCELISAMAGVLERNISVDFARTFKRRAAEHSGRLAALVRAQLPHLDQAAALHFAGAAIVIVAGMWPYSRPTEAVAVVMGELGMPSARQMFTAALTDGLINQLVGLVARASAG